MVSDLEIAIRLDGSLSLSFEISAPDEGINSLTLPLKPLPAAPEKFLHHLFKDLENLPLDTEKASRAAEAEIADKGQAIWELFPLELQEILWKRRRRALTLLIQSEESYIPWEIARLQSRNRRGQRILGPFLCEAFAVTRWIRGKRHRTHLPLRNLALVVPQTSQCTEFAAEQKEIRALAERQGREVSGIDPTFLSVRQAMISGVFDGWHFAGYGAAISDNANQWGIELDKPPPFTTEDLLSETRNLGLARPLIFLSGCAMDRSALALTPPGDWARSFLDANAGAFIGTYWKIGPGKSREMAKAIYKGLFEGKAIGEAVRLARLHLHKRYQRDPTWLAYTIFAHPLASSEPPAVKPTQRRQVEDQQPVQLTPLTLSWRKDIDSPGALLRAQYGVVPFHRREAELRDLLVWCRDPSSMGVRLYTGPGGTGKTRLAHEVASQMRAEGWWAGFVTSEALHFPEKTWEALARPEVKVLMIVDYAETNQPFLISILRAMYRTETRPIRLLLLARDAFGWWEQLKSEKEGVAEILNSQASRHSLSPLADSMDARLASYKLAAHAFSQRLQVTPPSEPPTDLDADFFDNGLLLHMKALIEVEGEEKAKGEDGILDRVLARERKFWEVHVRDRGLPPEILPGIGSAMAVITLGGGVAEEKQAVEVLRKLRFFENRPRQVIVEVARLLHDIYPGKRWIEPLQPDLLGEHLAQRELEKGADELLDLVLGPRSGA